MGDLFDPSARQSIRERFDRLSPASQRRWGKMDVALMLAHCAVALEEAASGPGRQVLLGKLFGGLAKRRFLTGDAPFGRNAPTAPSYRVTSPREFAAEKARVETAVARVVERGRAAMDGVVHPFFGRLSGDEWGRLFHKHLDHHLRQFGA